MTPEAKLLHDFYAAFGRLDADAMALAYAADAQFSDCAFDLNGRDEIMAMWRMLCDGAKQSSADVWQLEFSGIEADAQRGQAHWEPHYRFGPGKRLVHNIIDARFQFRDGLIVRHSDRFDFWRWSRAALGPVGWALGWSPFLQAQVRTKAAAGLAAYRQRTGR